MIGVSYSSIRRISYVERQVRRMLRRFRVKFRHRAYVEGREVDFLIPRPGRPGLLLEVDGDIFHFDLEARKARDKILTGAGWEVMHFWGSEVLNTPIHVEEMIEAELVGVPRLPKKKKKRKSLDTETAVTSGRPPLVPDPT